MEEALSDGRAMEVEANPNSESTVSELFVQRPANLDSARIVSGEDEFQLYNGVALPTTTGASARKMVQCVLWLLCTLSPRELMFVQSAVFAVWKALVADANRQKQVLSAAYKSKLMERSLVGHLVAERMEAVLLQRVFSAWSVALSFGNSRDERLGASVAKEKTASKESRWMSYLAREQDARLLLRVVSTWSKASSNALYSHELDTLRLKRDRAEDSYSARVQAARADLLMQVAFLSWFRASSVEQLLHNSLQEEMRLNLAEVTRASPEPEDSDDSRFPSKDQNLVATGGHHEEEHLVMMAFAWWRELISDHAMHHRQLAALGCRMRVPTEGIWSVAESGSRRSSEQGSQSGIQAHVDVEFRSRLASTLDAALKRRLRRTLFMMWKHEWTLIALRRQQDESVLQRKMCHMKAQEETRIVAVAAAMYRFHLNALLCHYFVIWRCWTGSPRPNVLTSRARGARSAVVLMSKAEDHAFFSFAFLRWRRLAVRAARGREVRLLQCVTETPQASDDESRCSSKSMSSMQPCNLASPAMFSLVRFAVRVQNSLQRVILKQWRNLLRNKDLSGGCSSHVGTFNGFAPKARSEREAVSGSSDLSSPKRRGTSTPSKVDLSSPSKRRGSATGSSARKDESGTPSPTKTRQTTTSQRIPPKQLTDAPGCISGSQTVNSLAKDQDRRPSSKSMRAGPIAKTPSKAAPVAKQMPNASDTENVKWLSTTQLGKHEEGTDAAPLSHVKAVGSNIGAPPRSAEAKQQIDVNAFSVNSRPPYATTAGAPECSVSVALDEENPCKAEITKQGIDAEIPPDSNPQIHGVKEKSLRSERDTRIAPRALTASLAAFENVAFNSGIMSPIKGGLGSPFKFEAFNDSTSTVCTVIHTASASANVETPRLDPDYHSQEVFDQISPQTEVSPDTLEQVCDEASQQNICDTSFVVVQDVAQKTEEMEEIEGQLTPPADLPGSLEPSRPLDSALRALKSGTKTADKWVALCRKYTILKLGTTE